MFRLTFPLISIQRLCGGYGVYWKSRSIQRRVGFAPQRLSAEAHLGEGLRKYSTFPRGLKPMIISHLRWD